MKNWIKSMFIVLCGMMIVTTFLACGNDDEDDNGGGGVVDNSSLIGTWRKYQTDSQEVPTSELAYVLWVFDADGMMYEHDIDDNLNIIEGKTETFKYKTENGHLYTTQKQKDGKEDDWKDEGAYSISNNILELTKDSGKVRRLLKIK